MPEMRDQWAIFFAFIALLPVRFAFVRLQSPIKILIFAGKMCIFASGARSAKRQQVSHLQIYDFLKSCCEFELEM